MDIYSIILLLCLCFGFGYGVQDDCSSLFPTGKMPQMSSKYSITIDSCSSTPCQYIAGGNVTVTISVQGSKNSIVLQARAKSTNPVGTFSTLGLGKVVDCSPYPKSTFVLNDFTGRVKVLWKAPPEDATIGLQIEFDAFITDASNTVWQAKSVRIDQQKSKSQVAQEGKREDEITAQIKKKIAENYDDELQTVGQVDQVDISQMEKEEARKQQEQNDFHDNLANQGIQKKEQISSESEESKLYAEASKEAERLALQFIQSLTNTTMSSNETTTIAFSTASDSLK